MCAGRGCIRPWRTACTTSGAVVKSTSAAATVCPSCWRVTCWWSGPPVIEMPSAATRSSGSVAELLAGRVVSRNPTDNAGWREAASGQSACTACTAAGVARIVAVTVATTTCPSTTPAGLRGAADHRGHHQPSPYGSLTPADVLPAATRPDLAAQWSNLLNGGGPGTLTTGSGVKAWWRCPYCAHKRPTPPRVPARPGPVG